jgi:molecular chaperone DnaK (HSP70)
MTIMGIDLGTTQSCVAIPARPGMVVDEPVEIVADYMERKTTPSVVMEDHGNILVGWRAKQSAGLQPKPIFFIKRSMGTDHTKPLNGKDCNPEEISAETLKYLRQMTADFLELPLEQVKKAVICVPAYFNLQQSQATKKAGELAGLEVMAVLMEPIAAALAYGLKDRREDLKIFCYDLGGGTFDATVLEKTQGEHKVLAFGGDPYLGGCDFDKLLANYLLGKLKDRYRLDLDFDNETDDALYQAFMAVAEKYKHKLSDDLEVRVREVDFKDQAGTAMSIDMFITRKEFEDLIRGEVDRGLEELWEDYKTQGREKALTNFLVREGARPEEIEPRQLDQELKELERRIELKPESIKKTRYLSMMSMMKSGLFPQELDEVIMVGGSSHIPMVAEELADLFGKRPTLQDPDAIVAKGAALKAMMLTPQGEGVAGLTLHRLPRETFLTELTIAGQMDLQELQVSLEQVRLRLQRAPDFEQEISPDAQGSFLFEMVELLPNCENHLKVSALAGGRNLAAYEFSIRHHDEAEHDAGVESVDTDFLTRNIYIDTVDGLRTIFQAGDKIPHKSTLSFFTADTSGKIQIPILEGYQVRGTIGIKNLSTSLPIGTPGQVSIEVTKDLDIFVQAQVMDRQGEVTIKIENLPLPPLDEMQARFEKLRDDFDLALEIIKDRNEKLKVRRKGRELIRAIEREFAHHPPTGPKIASMLEDLDYLVKKINATKILTPSLEEFQEKVKEALDKDKDKKYTKNIEALQEEGEKAYEARNEKQWQMVNRRLDELIGTIGDDGGGIDLPPEILAPFWKLDMMNKVRELSKQAQQRGEEQKYAGRLEDLRRKVEAVDVEKDPADALRKIAAIYQNDYQPLHYEITGSTDMSAPGEGFVKV